ncbi:MAG TPA: hypothetical protein VMG12_38685 [Polyangiaceae bacterium]|nr:hypothetical protein [Polyangiaceae bacterium]
MNVTILFVALVVFAFFAAHLFQRYASRLLPISGAEYLVIGALIGPHIPLRVLTEEALASLAPLVSLLLGLSGFLIGLQATRNFRELRPSIAGLGLALSTLVSVALVFAALHGWVVPLEEPPLVHQWLFELGGYNVELFLTRPQVAVALVIGAIATVTFSGTLARPGRERLDRVPAFHLLRSYAFSGQVVAICTVAAVLAWTRSNGTGHISLPPAAWFVAVLSLGVALGFCFTLFTGSEQSASRIFVISIGTVTFGAGIGAELGVSSLFVNLVTGVTVGLTLKQRGNLQRELSRLEYPISVLLLMLTGALWAPPESALFWLFPIVYLPSRWLARMTLPALWTRLVTRVDPTRVGAGLLGQGTPAVALAVDYALQVPERSGVLTTAIVGTLVFDIVGRRSLERYLIDAEAESGVIGEARWGRDGANA